MPQTVIDCDRADAYRSVMELRWPDALLLDSYTDALRRGWSPDTMRQEAAAQELTRIERDVAAFLRSLVDREAAGPLIPLPDGSLGERLPGYRKWMWDGEFCGSIGLRWQPGTSALPPLSSATSVTAWCRGSAVAGTPRRRCG